MTFFKRITVFLMLTTLLHATIEASDSPYKEGKSVFVSYANADGNTDLSNSPTIYISFNGSSQRVPFIMDTGSVGIVASSDIFTPAAGASNLGVGQQIYSSSGIIENGTWWSATQEIYDADGHLLAMSNVPVLQVTSVTCTNDARDCTPNNNPTGISVMGVGFARESDQQVRGTPNYNAFLNLTSVRLKHKLKKLPKTWCNGYVVTPTGVYLGLDSDNTANAGFVKLLPWTEYSTSELSEWMAAPMTINANGVSGNGNILMDTGVGDAFLTPPQGASLGTLVTCPSSNLVECIPNGDVIGVYLPDETNPVAFYTFTVGDSGNLMEPNGVHVVSGSNVFFNSSRHVLGGINFLYDNTNGYIGYIWNGSSPSDVGYVHPATATSSTVLTTLTNPSNVGDTVTFKATAVGFTQSQIPTGGITFIIDGVQEYVALDNNGVATYSTSELTKGKHKIVAKYSGDSTYVRSTSNHLTQKVRG